MYMGTIQTLVADVQTSIADKYVPLYAPEINYNCKFERKCARCNKTDRQNNSIPKEKLINEFSNNLVLSFMCVKIDF